MARRIGRSQGWHFEEPWINLTPLIDVVFVILIMFIVIAPMLELDRVDLADGSSDDAGTSIAVQETSPVSIHVRANNSIQFNQREVTLEELPQLLREAKARYPQAKPQLFHDKRASFGTYQAIKNAAESAGYQQMDVILKPG